MHMILQDIKFGILSLEQYCIVVFYAEYFIHNHIPLSSGEVSHLGFISTVPTCQYT